MDPLQFSARHAKWVLAAGLLAAILLPSLARALSGWLVPLIMLIMCLGALRLPPQEALDVLRRPGRAMGPVLALQVAVPMALMALLWAFGLSQQVWAVALVLVMSAPAIVSSPNMAAILGLDTAMAMRLVVWGTVLVPVTSMPAMMLLFGAADLGAVVVAAARIAAVIVVAGGIGLALRATFFRDADAVTVARLDGASALALAVFVIGLMAELQTSFATAPVAALGWIAFAFVINFGPQIGWLRARVRQSEAPETAAALALVSGNRNFALFFAALAPELTAPLLPFLAAYQFPMYLTPLCLGAIYARILARARSETGDGIGSGSGQ